MCYRYSLATPRADLQQLFDLEPPELGPRYNIALTQPVPAVRLTDGTRSWSEFRFGLIPRWSREDRPAGYGNARSETVAEKASFRDAFRKRRCLVPADGFYEWETIGKQKLPWRLTLADGRPFAFAGIWETWINPEGRAIDSLAILTTDANELISGFHDRMPVIIDRPDHATWLEAPFGEVGALLRPFPAERMRAFRVDTRMNSPRHDAADCITPLLAG
jgi:putative SOS response-associated peptidase YedK